MVDVHIYFGCWREAGHYRWSVGPRRMREDMHLGRRLPTSAELDASPLFLPQPEQPGRGCLTFLPAPRLTILAWWGSPWDSRPGVNAAYIVNGDYSETAAWQSFVRYFPDVAAHIERPAINDD